MFKIIYILMFSVLSQAYLAQNNAKEDFIAINKFYNLSKNIAMDLKYELYYDGASVASDVQMGKYVKSGNRYYTQQGLNTMLLTDKHLIAIEHAQKVMIIDKKIDEKKLENPLSIKLDSLYSKYNKIEPIETKEPHIKAYRFHISQGPYSLCDVYFDDKNKYVTQIINVFRDKQPDENNQLRLMVLKTQFFNYDLSTKPEKLIDEINYFSYSNKKIILNSTYKSYRLINHLNE